VITATATVPREAAAPLTVQCIEDSFGFTALRPRWNELLHDSAADNPFLTWDWLHTWWVHLREASALRLIVVRAGDELIAIAPLRLVQNPLSFMSRLEFLGTGNAGSDYLDLIIRRGREAEGIQAIARYLKSRNLAVRFNHLPPTSLAAQLAAQLAGEGWTTATADDGTCPVIPLAGHTFDTYLATLGSSHRANVRRRIKALGQQFEMRFEPVTAHAERRQMLDALAVFHAKRYSDRGGSSAFSAASVRAFQEEVTRRALDRGWLRMYSLRLNGEIAAVMYGFNYGGTFYFYQHGFDDRYKAQSVGLVLMGLSIRAAIDEGAGEFDMLWGTEPYKFLWARDARILQRIEMFPLHLGGTIHRHAVEARRSVGKLARRVLSIGDSLGS
jgi:CelD/BcsL family acetyltransferase involved in cellulose biosynthesis